MTEPSPYEIAWQKYQKERQEQFARGVDHIPLDVSELRRVMSLIVREDIRFVPVITCAFADDELGEMFRMFLPNDIPGGKNGMLGRYGPISNLFARIQFAFAFDMVHTDILLALDMLRKHRNNIAHTWDQDALKDFLSTPLPKMDELENALLHGDVKDGGECQISPEASLRLRSVWLLARLFYETRFYTLAKMAKLTPFDALYGDGQPKAFAAVAAAGHLYTQLIFDRD